MTTQTEHHYTLSLLTSVGVKPTFDLLTDDGSLSIEVYHKGLFLWVEFYPSGEVTLLFQDAADGIDAWDFTFETYKPKLNEMVAKLNPRKCAEFGLTY